jgi:tRNA nucleotidyltransferase/poly(A) polymerase
MNQRRRTETARQRSHSSARILVTSILLAGNGRIVRGLLSNPSSRLSMAQRNLSRRRVLMPSMMAADSRELRFFSCSSDLLSGSSSTVIASVPFNEHHSLDANSDEANSKSSGPRISLTSDEAELFHLLRKVTGKTGIKSTLRVAGGWVRDKLLATPEFQKNLSAAEQRLTSKSTQASMGRQGTKVVMEDMNQPVDIDIALDDMLGREFADHLNDYLCKHGQETVSVGVVLKNPEKSKHLETATMKVGSFWIDFVNLRAEEYTKDSRIPDLMRIGTPAEDAFRRDLTINALFYNINTQQVEDFTGRGFEDLRRGLVTTPVAPLTTLMDDPLRVLRSVRFASRLRFTMDQALVKAAMDNRVRDALAQKVSRERIGGEVDLMFRSPDPVGAMRLLINLNLVETVFSVDKVLPNVSPAERSLFTKGLDLLSTTHNHLCDCKFDPPVWCESSRAPTTHGFVEETLLNNEEARRLLWYAAFLKPIMDYSKQFDESMPSPNKGKKANKSVISRLLVEELKRPVRDAESVVKIMKAADDFTQLRNSGCDLSAQSILLSSIEVVQDSGHDIASSQLTCKMQGKVVCGESEDDPLWEHAMEFRLLTSKVLQRVGSLWRPALILSLCEQLQSFDTLSDYAIEGDFYSESQEELHQGIVDRYDAFALALQKLGLIGIWDRKPLLDGEEIKHAILPNLPRGPIFREVMDEQEDWMTAHPDGAKEALSKHLGEEFSEFA